jgi:response regulator RpfG family c-di-GMP phosphodiesterase
LDVRLEEADWKMRPSILVVDDDSVARTFAGRTLQAHYDVDFAANTHEARGKPIGEPIDLLFCDIYLPGENGMELVETVLSREDKSLETERVRQLLRRSEESLERSRLETVRKLSLAVEMRDQVTGHHLSRMAAYSEELARRLELPDEICDSIALAAQMHDIGKVAVPDHILLKTGP